MGWMDLMSKRNKGELAEKKAFRKAREELKQLRDKHLNNCIDGEIQDFREDCINRLKVTKSNAKRDLDKLSRGWWK